MKRRAFLGALGAAGAISMLDWLRLFRESGVPAGARDLGIAEAIAQVAPPPRTLIYWFQEGGWDGYSMFNPVSTRNDALGPSTVPPAAQIYRPAGVPLVGGMYPVSKQGAIRYGNLAAAGRPLFGDMAVVSSHHGGTFHSGSRLDYHMGKYAYVGSAQRQPDERSVMQAFCETYGQAYLLPHVSWHRWLADGELSIANYPEGTGYYEKLGPTYAHTVYGGTPGTMRQRLTQIAASSGAGRDAVIHKFVDNLHSNFIKDKHSETVRAFASAVDLHRTLVTGGGNLNAASFFGDPVLRAEFGVQPDDELTSSLSISKNPARSKESPNTNVQALMAYELLTKGLSIGFWIESRTIRGFDTHASRATVLHNQGQANQQTNMDANLWTPLKALVARLKNTQVKATGKSYFDTTTIVLASEMGRSMSGGDDDVCQHWSTSSVAFLGGGVKGGTQWGGVGSTSLDAIPILPSGALDPAFDPVTGVPLPGKQPDPAAYVSDAGHVYATALELAGIAKGSQTGKNGRPSMAFLKK